MKRMIYLLFILLLFIMWAPGPVYGKIPRRESDALRTLFNAAGGSNWHKRGNWKGAPGTEHTWYGITCNATNTMVAKIDLGDNNLRGTLPADLSDLSNLKTLVLNGNRLTGLHPDLGKLSKLTTLDVSNNQLAGPIPSWIAKLKNLKKLDLSYNRFTGRIPSWIGKLKNLEELRLDGNRLRGAIPKELANLSKLTVLRLGHNGLTGEIPSSLGKLTRLADNKSNFKWNGLFTGNTSLKAFLKKKQRGRDWESTQTVPPGEITWVSNSNTSITISWKPIKYTEDSGGYRVFYGVAPEGPYNKSAGTVDDKTRTELEVKELEKSTTYYFVVQVWTAPHGSNRNRIESVFSKEIAATTRGTTISGSVKNPGGQGVPGVELTASDNQGKAFTDSKGNYYLGVTPGWSGTVMPSKKGYDFSPPDLKYNNVDTDRDGQDYTADANTKISGKVTDQKGKGIPGVRLTFSDNIGTAAAVTDSTGYYIHTVIYNWQGTVTPSKNGYLFDPSSREYTDVTSARVEKEYKTFRPPEISGRVRNRRGKAVPDVNLTFSGKGKTAAETLKTNEKGKYSRVFANDWSGKVKPVKPGYIFYPAKKHYQNMTRDITKTAENYKAELNLKFFISVIGSYMIPAQENFSDIYGSGMVHPGIKAGYKFYRSFYLWGGYDVSSKKGKTLQFEEPSKWKERFFSGGLGYNGNMSINFAYKAEIGMLYVVYREEAFDEEVTGSAIGVRIGGAGIFKISDRLFTEISMGYLAASDKTIVDDEDISLKLGGFRGGIGLGIRF